MLCHFPTLFLSPLINSHHVTRLARNGQSENKAHKMQLVGERQLCKEQSRHKGRTNCMNFMLSVQGLTGLYYFDRLLSLFTRCWIMRKASSQRHWYCSQNCTCLWRVVLGGLFCCCCCFLLFFGFSFKKAKLNSWNIFQIMKKI